MLTIGIGVCQLHAVIPDSSSFQYTCVRPVLFSFLPPKPNIREQVVLSPVFFIQVCSRIVDMDDVPIAGHVAVVDVQRLLSCRKRGNRIHGAVVKVNLNIRFPAP